MPSSGRDTVDSSNDQLDGSALNISGVMASRLPADSHLGSVTLGLLFLGFHPPLEAGDLFAEEGGVLGW